MPATSLIEDEIIAVEPHAEPEVRPMQHVYTIQGAVIGLVTLDEVRTAIHEAGHMTCHRLFGCTGVTGSIDPGQASSCTLMLNTIVDELRDQMTISAAGIAATLIWQPDADDGGGRFDAEDFQNTKTDRLDMLQKARLLHGMFAPEDQLHAEIDQAIERAEAMLRPAWTDVIEVAECLIRTHYTLGRIVPITTKYANRRFPHT